MIENYRKVQINYDQLDTISLPNGEPIVLTVNWNEVKYEFLIRKKDHSSNLLIFGAGAMFDQIGLPYFQRHSWMYDLEDSTIYYNDPTLYLSNLPAAWGQGTWDRFYLKDIADILTKLIAKVGVSPKQVLLYGSSGGGFMSLILGGFIRESSVLVDCPQTCLIRWIEDYVKQVFNISYPSLSVQDVMQAFPERIDVMKFYNQIKYVPKIYYLQNAACEFDVTNHLLPFLSELQFMEPGCVVNKVIVDLYYDKQPGPDFLPALGGHGALGKYETINYINQIKPK
ncbi:glycosyl transferase family 2 [Tumebacillus lipolyticus]|uniref:Glycosyl transferase family 2 n=1 Tax=Tumebacillus lipolyticus TaxID=1280370 RepID=A0ABW4ZYB0_9BACL